MSLIKNFSQRQDMIFTENLDSSSLGLYTMGFRLTDVADDPWSIRFNNFKVGHPQSVRAGVKVLGEGIRSVPWKPRRRIIVGAISSKDKQLATTCPVYALCRGIAAATGWEWRQDILSKTVHQSLHRVKGGIDRDSVVHNTYTSGVIGGEAGAVMIVDDFVTRGATGAEIARAIGVANPGWRYVSLSLAKTERSAYWDGAISNSHIPDRFEKLWDAS